MLLKHFYYHSISLNSEIGQDTKQWGAYYSQVAERSGDLFKTTQQTYNRQIGLPLGHTFYKAVKWRSRTSSDHVSLIRNRGNHDFLSTWEEPWHQQSVWLSFWRASPGVNTGDVALLLQWLQRERVTLEAAGRWVRCRTLTLPWSTQDGHCPLVLFSWGENFTTYFFFQSTCKTKSLSSNMFSQVKTFQDLRNAHLLKTIFLTCNLVSYPWFRKVPGGPVSSGNSVGFMVWVSGVFCLPWSSRETKRAEGVNASIQLQKAVQCRGERNLIRISPLSFF